MSQVARYQRSDELIKEPEKSLRLPIRRIDPSYQAFRVLRIGFAVAPIIAGTDKFTNRLVQWEQYLSPVVPRKLGIKGKDLMKFVGAFEILAGIGVAFKPKIFGYVVSGWLAV